MIIAKREVHRVAMLFPMMEGVEYDALVTDIAANGLRSPITLLDDRILDGRNRARACQDAKVKPRFEQYGGDDPLAFVVSQNLHRRHLNTSQRALIAAKISNLPPHRPSKSKVPKSGDFPAHIAAELLSVGRGTVEQAKTVLDHALPEVVASIERGHLTINAASQLAKLPPDIQRGVVDRAWGEDDEGPLDADELRDVVRRHRGDAGIVKMTLVMNRALRQAIETAAKVAERDASALCIECLEARFLP